MKIEMYQGKGRNGADGYRLTAETREEKLILGSLRNSAFFTDGKLIYCGCSSQEQDQKDNLVSQVKLSHNMPLEDMVEEEIDK